MKAHNSVLVAFLTVVISLTTSAKESNTYRKHFDQPTVIKGMTVIGEVEYYRNDTLEFARLARDDSVFGQKFLTGTGIHFKENGKIDWCFLSKDCDVQGHTFVGGGHEWMTCFYPSGRLESGGLASVQVIDGIPCAEGTFWNEAFGGGGRTYFYEDGKLKYAKVARTIVYQGTTINKGKHVKLKPDGTIDFIK